MASPEAANALLATQIRANPDSPSARAASVAISRLAAPDVVNVLGAALAQNETPAAVQRSLVAGLVSVGNQESINYLMEYLNQPNGNRKLPSNEIQALMIPHRYSPEALKALRSWQGNLQGTNSLAWPVVDAILQKASANKP